MAHGTDLGPKWGGDLQGIAIVIGTAVLASGLLFAVLYIVSLYHWR